jgi:hypothetical protein
MDQVEQILQDRYRVVKPPSIVENLASRFIKGFKDSFDEVREQLKNSSKTETDDFDLGNEFKNFPRRNSTEISYKKAFAAAAMSAAKNARNLEVQLVVIPQITADATNASVSEATALSVTSSTSTSTSTELPTPELLSAPVVTEEAAVPDRATTAAHDHTDTDTTTPTTDTDGTPTDIATAARFQARRQKMIKFITNIQKGKIANAKGGNFFPGGLYLRKMRKGERVLTSLAMKEVRSGPRIGVINAVGGINTGSSSSGGLNGE